MPLVLHLPGRRRINCRITENDKGVGGDMCWEQWKLIGLCALALGVSILIVAIFPVGFLMLLIAALLIFCGIGLINRR